MMRSGEMGEGGGEIFLGGGEESPGYVGRGKEGAENREAAFMELQGIEVVGGSRGGRKRGNTIRQRPQQWRRERGLLFCLPPLPVVCCGIL